MSKGIYIVSEPSCLVSGSGAYRHIEVGCKYLGEHFDLIFYPLCQTPVIDSQKINIRQSLQPPKDNLAKRILKKIGLWHTIKDLRILFDNHRSIFDHYKAIKKLSPDFIYERCNFLNFQGILISKWLRIPHFYENNGIKYLEHQERVNTWLGWLWKYLEKWAYKSSDFVFFVGLWGDKINLPTKNWMNIENGVEQSFLDHFRDHQKVLKNKINICFVGSLMPHHGFYLLLEALKGIDSNLLHLHLIGSKLETVATESAKIVETTYHGFLEREDLAVILEQMHIGIIPNARSYQSQMKLFDYGAAKCLVIAPDLKNLKHWFSDNEIEFFEKDNVYSLLSKIKKIKTRLDLINKKGGMLYSKILKEFTWDKIFRIKSDIINSFLH